MTLQWDESFDIGSNTGKLNKLTSKIQRPHLTPADIKRLEEMVGDGRGNPANHLSTRVKMIRNAEIDLAAE